MRTNQWVTGKQKIQHGFTLIQLMFGIVIFGAISALYVNFSQDDASDVKVQRAALEMKMILEAGAAYHAKYKLWPANVPILVHRGYLPAKVSTSATNSQGPCILPKQCTNESDCIAKNPDLKGNDNTYTVMTQFYDECIDGDIDTNFESGDSATDDLVTKGEVINPWGESYHTGYSYSTAQDGTPYIVRTKTNSDNNMFRLMNLLPRGNQSITGRFVVTSEIRVRGVSAEGLVPYEVFNSQIQSISGADCISFNQDLRQKTRDYCASLPGYSASDASYLVTLQGYKTTYKAGGGVQDTDILRVYDTGDIISGIFTSGQGDDVIKPPGHSRYYELRKCSNGSNWGYRFSVKYDEGKAGHTVRHGDTEQVYYGVMTYCNPS